MAADQPEQAAPVTPQVEPAAVAQRERQQKVRAQRSSTGASSNPGEMIHRTAPCAAPSILQMRSDPGGTILAQPAAGGKRRRRAQCRRSGCWCQRGEAAMYSSTGRHRGLLAVACASSALCTPCLKAIRHRALDEDFLAGELVDDLVAAAGRGRLFGCTFASVRELRRRRRRNCPSCRASASRTPLEPARECRSTPVSRPRRTIPLGPATLRQQLAVRRSSSRSLDRSAVQSSAAPASDRASDRARPRRGALQGERGSRRKCTVSSGPAARPARLAGGLRNDHSEPSPRAPPRTARYARRRPALASAAARSRPAASSSSAGPARRARPGSSSAGPEKRMRPTSRSEIGRLQPAPRAPVGESLGRQAGGIEQPLAGLVPPVPARPRAIEVERVVPAIGRQASQGLPLRPRCSS